MTRIIALLILIVAVNGCSTHPLSSRSSSPSIPRVENELPVFNVKNDSQVGCIALTGAYCKSLYQPLSLGNMEVVRPKGNIKILQGETFNDFNQMQYHYSRAKIQRKDALPKMFVSILEDQSYFQKLAALLNRPPRNEMTYQDRIRFDRMSAETEHIWDSALDETLLRRLIAKYPGFHRIRSKEMPPEYEIEYQREKRNLLNQISLALWKEDKKWHQVIETFRDLQDAYLAVISRLDVDDKTKAKFSERIQKVQLVLPGSIPEISDYECSSTTANAYYYKFLNIITVCAGDFNSEDILQTLAHEMGHALDVSRSAYMFKMGSELVARQKSLRNQVCHIKKVDCIEWNEFKKNLALRLEYFEGYKPELYEFNQCLKRRPTTKVPGSQDFDRIAHSMTSTVFSSLAGADYFLRIIKDKLPLRNDKLVKNPYYLNPCQYYLWTKEEEPPEDEINSLTYFTAEYSCQNSNKSDAFKQAIEVSKEMTEMVMKTMLKVNVEFSSNEFTMKEGFSSPPVERYADVLGSYAVAEYLKKFHEMEDRRGKVLASISWLCSEPSLKSHFPEESKIENDYNDDSHTEGFLRFQEILAPPLRSILQCQKDFEFNECQLPIK
jgi:hypothetical protein